MDIDYIVKSAQIASCLEVSGYPKPGNVHRTRDFPDMVFEDFLISGIVIGDSVKKLAIRTKSANDLSEIGLGEAILEAVKETDKWVSNNTNLGIIMLIFPLAGSAAISDNFNELRENLNEIIISTTPHDTANLYDAINIAEAGGLGSNEEYDVTSEDSKKELIENNTNMFDVYKISESWDKISYELINKMPVSFDIGQKVFNKYKSHNSYNIATLNTFLTILSEVEDTLISRKYGSEVAMDVSKKAEIVLKSDISTLEGQKKLAEFDDYLFSNKLNPGTTADFTASSIFLNYLFEGYNFY